MTRRSGHAHAEEVQPSRDIGVEGLGLFAGSTELELTPITRRTTVRAHLRRIEGPPLSSGEKRKQDALAKHERNAVKRRAVEYLRARLVMLYRSRDTNRITWPIPYVNADDAVRLFNQWAHRPTILDTIGGYWRGPVFKRGFEKIKGLSHPSLRDELKGTDLPAWRPLP
jgi:hypothetical protein